MEDDDDEDEYEGEGEDVFTMEEIYRKKVSEGVGKNGFRKGLVLYELKWAGYTETTWEPAYNINYDDLAFFEEWWAAQEAAFAQPAGTPPGTPPQLRRLLQSGHASRELVRCTAHTVSRIDF